MAQEIKKRIEALREWLNRNNLSAFIIPSSDPHLSEYVAPHWKSREWFSGFTGSAGTVVVTADKAGLWTDSRYFIQAADQLAGTGIDLYKEMLPETPSIDAFILENLPADSAVGIDGRNLSVNYVENLQQKLSQKQISLNVQSDPMEEIWQDRPAIPQTPPFIYDIKYAGKSCKEKIEEIRQELRSKNCDSILITALDEIAWTLNLRGNDVKYNPVVISYLLITQENAVFFILPEKVTPEIDSYLKQQGVAIVDYNETDSYLSTLSAPSILLDPVKTNYFIYSSVNSECRIVRDSSPVALMKAIRNPQELIGVHSAMKKDGVAMVKFLRWLEEVVPSGKETEMSIDRKLYEFRSQQELFMGESFGTIAGYKEHGAIIHYSATSDTDATLRAESFLLLDSGAQYLDGTTDITRTIALGELTEEEKRDYTLVLKGHLMLNMARFPKGTRGAQLDVLARLPLWKEGLNYLYGTGHGIGHFLNVHEGPQSIRMNENPVVLQPGMVTSNEPGVYRPGKHGVRTENLFLVVEDGEGMYGEYYKCETITLCPICKKGIVKELLSPEEIEWLNDYHKKVYEVLSPELNAEEKEWLKDKTSKL